MTTLARGITRLLRRGGHDGRLTLSLEGTSLRILRTRGGRVEQWTSLPFNPRLVRAGRIEDPAGLAEVIRNGLSHINQASGAAPLVVAFPSSQMIVRFLTVPRLRGVQPEALIPREARRILGSAADQHLLYWTPIAGTPLEDTYYLLAVSRTEMAQFMETLLLSGLKPRRIEARPLALARAMPEDDSTVLRLEATELSVIVIVDRVPALITRRTIEPTMTPEDLLAEIIDAVQAAVAFQASRTDSRSLPADAPLYLVGGHPQQDDLLAAAVRDAVERSVRVPPSPLPAPEDFPASEYMVNLGMALSHP